MNDDTDKKPGNKKPAKTIDSKTGKSRDSNHSPDEEPAFNTVLGLEDEPAEGAPHGISRASAMLLFLLASLLGGVIGWGGPALFSGNAQKQASLEASLNQTKTDLATAETARAELANALATIQAEAKRTGSNTSAVSARLSEIQADLDALKAQPAPIDYSAEITALNERITALSAFSGDEGEEGENILALVERLETLEIGSEAVADLQDRLTMMELNGVKSAPVATFPEPDPEPINLPPVETVQDQQTALQVLIDSFPKENMLAAVKAQEALATRKPSWLQRLLSKHVKVRDTDKIAPSATIDRAETALKNGQISDAIKLINTLNPPVRSVAADWITAAKKAEKLIEKEL
jgi:hypothetical protein